MKELSIEQKAKAYDEAIERVENIKTGKCETTFMFTKGLFEHIFPELAESEDEKIRKGLIAIITDFDSLYLQENYSLSREDALTWLEKQGEHANFRDSIQVGDKVTRNEDGVLVNLSQLNRVAKKDGKQDGHTDIPADAVLDGNKDGLIADTIRCKRENQCEQKPWSEEDELCLTETLYLIRNSYSVDDKVERLSNWVKSIKDRLLPQLKQEWSEVDEDMLYKAISVFNKLCAKREEFVWSAVTLNKIFWWLKSLKDRYAFKPSEEQLNGLKEAIEFLGCTKTRREQLQSLYEQLKKLREK